MAIPLSKKNKFTSICKVCGAGAYLFDVVDFNKICLSSDPYYFGLSGIPIYYSRCSSCGFIFTGYFDSWSPSKFADMIYNNDYALVDGEYSTIRPNSMAKKFSAAFPQLTESSILDYGSGSGIFANHLKENGFKDIVSYDPYSTPERPAQHFDIITCFEVLEHTPNPIATLKDMLSFAKPETAIIFTTLLQPDTIGVERANFWYIAPRNGHVSIFSRRSLSLLADAFHLNFLPGSFHILAPQNSKLIAPPGMLPLVSRVLNAPEQNCDGWQGRERSGEHNFRWTGTEEISWNVELPKGPYTIEIRIPYINEVMPGFAEQCLISIADSTSIVSIVRDADCPALKADLRVDNGDEQIIKLTTPRPARPCDLRPDAKDARPLGLAILTR